MCEPIDLHKKHYVNAGSFTRKNRINQYPWKNKWKPLIHLPENFTNKTTKQIDVYVPDLFHKRGKYQREIRLILMLCSLRHHRWCQNTMEFKFNKVCTC
jgi:hypothetical protein